MKNYEQGGLDALCGIYSLVNAEQLINGTSYDQSKELFDKIIDFLKEEEILAKTLKEGMILKTIKRVLTRMLDDKIQYQELHFAGKVNPDLDTYWEEMLSFLNEGKSRAIIIGLEGVYSHWTVVKKISEKRIELFDSSGLKHLNRKNCTTYNKMGERHHILYPAQTYFLM